MSMMEEDKSEDRKAMDECVSKSCNTANNNNNEKDNWKRTIAAEKVDFKEEPKDDIKNYAEDTMNELLGWYGYGNEALGRASDQMRRKRGGDDTPPSVERVNIAVEDSDDESLSSRTSGRSQVTSSLDTIATLPRDTSDITVTEVKADEPTFVVCSWCQKGKSLEKQYVLLTSEGKRKFCSQQCFDQCRREKYRKHKICDWCKGPCGSSNIVEFEDGDGLYLFCSEDCLNKYKMNIFCQETQEHIKALQTDGGQKVSPAPSSDSQQIIITPDLWTDENQKQTSKRERKLGKAFVELPHSVEKNIRESMVSQTAMIPKMENVLEHKQVRHTKPVSTFRSKGDSEPTRHTRSSNQRPPRMTDREKIKQIRLRDNLPLYTPLRETCRTNSEAFSIASLTSRCPSSSSNPPKSASHQLSLTPSLASGLFTPSSSSQLLGALTGVGTASTLYSSTKGTDKDTSIDGRISTDSCSSASISPRTSSHTQNTPIPPLYPPPNPFTHTPIPSYFNNPSFPFPVPPALSMYSVYGPSPLLGSLATPMSSIMPPNTLMMPYPFVLPLPIPLPIPVPVTEKFIDDLQSKSEKSEEPSSGNDNSDIASKSDDLEQEENSMRVGHHKEKEDGIKLERSRPRGIKGSERRYYIDLDPANHTVSSSTAVDTDNEVMDLSTDTTRTRSRSRSPVEANTSSSQQDLPKENGNIVVIQPDDSRLTPPKSPFHSLSGSCSTSQKYSSRRNLILDAPNVQREGSLSPSPEKRSYNGTSVRDILYGKRKCVRPRVKTK